MKTIPKNTNCLNNSSFEVKDYLYSADAIECILPPAREAEDGQVHEIGLDDPRMVIRGESPKKETSRSQAALTDWLNVTFRFHPHDCTTDTFFTRFSEVTKGAFGGMTDQERGLHGWQHSFKFDRGNVVFAFGGQRYTAFLSLPGEGCSFITDWLSFSFFLRDELKARITRWDGAVDDFKGIHSVDEAVELYKSGGFNHGGRNPQPRQHGNWITPDTLGRTFEVGNRKNGKLIRIYEKGKQLGDPTNPWYAGKLNSTQMIGLFHGMYFYALGTM